MNQTDFQIKLKTLPKKPGVYKYLDAKGTIIYVGKAKNLKERLTPYNKTCNHEVVYYKECKSEEDMKIIEEIVINKLVKVIEYSLMNGIINDNKEEINVVKRNQKKRQVAYRPTYHFQNNNHVPTWNEGSHPGLICFGEQTCRTQRSNDDE